MNVGSQEGEGRGIERRRCIRRAGDLTFARAMRTRAVVAGGCSVRSSSV